MTEGVIATGSADYGDYRNRFFHLSMNEEVDLVYLVYLVCLVRWFVWFLSFFEPNQLNKQNKRDKPSTLIRFFPEPEHKPQSLSPQGHTGRLLLSPVQQFIQGPFCRGEFSCDPAYIGGIEEEGAGD